jgi:hypothetical protein
MDESIMVTITDELIESGKSAAGGYSKAQLAALGVAWPPISGWKSQIIGKQITSDAAARFVAGRGEKAEERGKPADLFDQ